MARASVKASNGNGADLHEERAARSAAPVKAAAKKKESIGLLLIERKTLVCKVIGESILVTNARDQQTAEDMETKRKGGAVQRKLLDEKLKFEKAMYRTSDGKPGILACSFKAAMVEAAGKHMGIEKKVVQRCLYVLGDILPILGPKPIMRRDMLPVGSGMRKGLDLRYRPEYRKWSVNLVIRFDANRIGSDQIVNLISHAGMEVGVGEGRPEKSKTLGWGLFDVDRKSIRIL